MVLVWVGTHRFGEKKRKRKEKGVSQRMRQVITRGSILAPYNPKSVESQIIRIRFRRCVLEIERFLASKQSALAYKPLNCSQAEHAQCRTQKRLFEPDSNKGQPNLLISYLNDVDLRAL